MPDCIFCRIAGGKIPCAAIYENEHVLSFLDINPINPGNALVVTKKHYPTILEVPKEELEACIVVVQKVAKAIHKAIKAPGMNVLQNNFRSAGQLIEHIHFHLIPRRADDGFLNAWPGRSCPPEYFDQTLDIIKAHL